MADELEEKLAHLPDKPGVYLMKDDRGQIIYVGKAVNLKNRVRSYFQSGKNHAPKVLALVARIKDLEYIITNSEIEALILECNLIKKHRPKYNISLRDDKSYPYVKVTREDFPLVYVTRKVIKDGAKYFGPYTDAGAVHDTLRLLKKMFPLRSCRNLDAHRPCLQHHIKRCLAPCSGEVDPQTYGEMIKAVCLLLEGRSETVVKDLKRRMEKAAEELQFEQAALIRDQIAAVNKVTEKQNIVTGAGDQDIIGLARSAAGICVQIFFVRSGKMVGREHFMLAGGEQEGDGEVLAAFVKQYYSQAAFIPREILLPQALEDAPLIIDWLTELKGGRVILEVPKRGTKKDLITMASDNATIVLQERAARLAAEAERSGSALAELAGYLELPGAPQRIECFDISHIQGAETVASMVVFENGAPKKADYRRYKLKTVEGKPDDFRSMQEVLSRRYRESAGNMPDLIVIDGGKGQLNAALEVIRGLGFAAVPVVGLAKEFEYIFREGESQPLVLPRNSQSLFLMQRIRDEAHRFAVTYHRKLRSKRNLVSVLDHVPGIGDKRRKLLIDHFGSLSGVKAATAQELADIPGMNSKAADAVYEFFRRGEGKAMNLTGVILAGGLSTRMGRDKADLPWGHSDILHTTLAEMAKACNYLIVVSNTPRIITIPGVRVVPDNYLGCGPLGGIQAGLAASATEYTFVAACDMPYINSAAIRVIADAAIGFGAAVPYIDGLFHPLHAVYHSSCRPPINEMLNEKSYRVTGLFKLVSTRLITNDELAQIDPGLSMLRNLNSPADLVL